VIKVVYFLQKKKWFYHEAMRFLGRDFLQPKGKMMNLNQVKRAISKTYSYTGMICQLADVEFSRYTLGQAIWQLKNRIIDR